MEINIDQFLQEIPKINGEMPSGGSEKIINILNLEKPLEEMVELNELNITLLTGDFLNNVNKLNMNIKDKKEEGYKIEKHEFEEYKKRKND